MQRLFWIVFAALVILHHDWWFWTDDRLAFGFVPVGLGYHMLVSLAAAALWGWAVFGVWPEIFAEQSEGRGAQPPDALEAER